MQKASFGSWDSPITVDLVVAGSLGIGEIRLDGDDIYWTEMRPFEEGRNTIVRCTADGDILDVTPKIFDVKSSVHEYGGGAFVVSDGVVYFSNYTDQRMYRQDLSGDPVPFTTPKSNMRYADGIVDHKRDLMVCVREDHNDHAEIINSIVSIDLSGMGEGDVLVSGQDFYASPRLAPDGRQLSWLSWNHPNMPWDGNQLWVANIYEDGTVGESELVAGGMNEAIFQPEWSPDGILHFISDRNGWWNLYRWSDGSVETLTSMEAEFGVAQWALGMSTYGFASNNRLICSYRSLGITYIASLDVATRNLEVISTPFSDITRSGLHVDTKRVVFGAASATVPESLVVCDLSTQDTKILRRSLKLEIDPGYISEPVPIAFPTENDLTAHAFLYQPTNKDYVSNPDCLPPLIVTIHGGPTGFSSPTLDLRTQYWTSRGFALLDINYGGSTGYGTAYRRRLNGNWGIVDVSDCINAVRYLIERRVVDPNKTAVRGSSAGGYTVLSILTASKLFKAGSSSFGVSDLEMLIKDTHKFESHYLETLIGPYPERRDLYAERSPINHVDRLNTPLIIFQGLEDKIVPPNQSKMMRDALGAKGVPVAYVTFEGEQHGFRRADNIKRMLEAETYFYAKIFELELPQFVTPVQIDNLS